MFGPAAIILLSFVSGLSALISVYGLDRILNARRKL
jgi:hypothetical protein